MASGTNGNVKQILALVAALTAGGGVGTGVTSVLRSDSQLVAVAEAAARKVIKEHEAKGVHSGVHGVAATTVTEHESRRLALAHPEADETTRLVRRIALRLGVDVDAAGAAGLRRPVIPRSSGRR